MMFIGLIMQNCEELVWIRKKNLKRRGEENEVLHWTALLIICYFIMKIFCQNETTSFMDSP